MRVDLGYRTVENFYNAQNHLWSRERCYGLEPRSHWQRRCQTEREADGYWKRRRINDKRRPRRRALQPRLYRPETKRECFGLRLKYR